MDKEKIQHLLLNGDYAGLQVELKKDKFHELEFKTEQEKRIANIILSKIDTTDEALLFASARFGSSIERTGNFRHIKVGEVFDKMASCIDVILKEKGFKYHKSKKTFLRKTSAGQDSIEFGSVNYAFYEIDATFGKRIDAINTISAKIVKETGIISNVDLETIMLNDTIWYTAGKIKPRLIAITWGYIAYELFELIKFIENEALPLFDKYESLDVLNQTYNYEAFKNKEELDPCNHFIQFTTHPKHYMSRIDGLICARLVNDANYELFYKKYLEIFSHNNYSFDERNYKAIEYTNDYLQGQ